MLVDAIIGIVVTLFTGVLALIPAYSIGSFGLGANLGSAMAGANSVFPVVTLGACIGVVIGARLFIAAVAVLAWIWSKIPFLFK